MKNNINNTERKGNKNVCKKCGKVIVGKNYHGLCEHCAKKNAGMAAKLTGAGTVLAGAAMVIGKGIVTVIKNQARRS